mmetsp:Transcript_30627/g.52417  ORF Transcript_30627/g.52417 Transcript_30627/m.52417 type:complete len:132 (+) Transcript_30627:197-592(+)
MSRAQIHDYEISLLHRRQINSAQNLPTEKFMPLDPPPLLLPMPLATGFGVSCTKPNMTAPTAATLAMTIPATAPPDKELLAEQFLPNGVMSASIISSSWIPIFTVQLSTGAAGVIMKLNSQPSFGAHSISP